MSSRARWEDELQVGLRRTHRALARPPGRTVAPPVDLPPGRERRRWERRAVREAWREERRCARRAEELASASRLQGWVYLVAAAVLALAALSRPARLWWLVFIAFWIGKAGGAILSRARRRGELLASGDGREETTHVKATDPLEARLARVEAVCARLIEELRESPVLVRDLVRRPDQTVGALRDTCHELARRERELRAALSPEDDPRLQTERSALAQRLASQTDPVVQQRLAAALGLLDQQLSRRAELLTAATRYEAEGTRLLYSLENLHTQLLRLRTADSASADVAGAGLRRGLELVREEVAALADALEDANATSSGSRVELRADPLGPLTGEPLRH